MGRERPDMFDVAAGECKLLDFLLTRFDPMDLKSRVSLDPSARFFEQMISPAAAATTPVAGVAVTQIDTPALIEVPLSLVSTPPPAPRPTSQVDGQDGFVQSSPQETDSADVTTLSEAPAPTPSPEDLMKLIQSFHAAAQQYKSETWDPSDPDQARPADESSP